ncbi:MAG TPA: nuclear transport factor 2 family protein [Acidobacteriaceae bacterium]|nr:nuclear transport factor 2 family protein [Acidobacteriaceae bacterium]
MAPQILKKTAADVALNFVDHINSHDIAALSNLVTEDVVFVDALGQEIRSVQRLKKGWLAYFTWFPDYSIQVDDAFSSGNVAGLFGYAHGTHAVQGQMLPENRWRIPAAWKAVIRNGQVAEWRVYADNEPVWKIMRVKRY